MLRALAPLGVSVLVIDDNSPDGTGEIADRLADGARFRLRAPSRPEGGPRPCVPRRLPARARRRRRLIPRDGLRLLARSADVPRLIAACEDGADLALGSRYVPGGGTANWGLGRRLVSWGGSFYARHRSRRAHPRSHRRLQVLPAAGPRDASTSTRSTRRVTRSRSKTTYRTLRAGIHRRRGADPLRRPHRGRVEDEPNDLSRGRRERTRDCVSQH